MSYDRAVDWDLPSVDTLATYTLFDRVLVLVTPVGYDDGVLGSGDGSYLFRDVTIQNPLPFFDFMIF